eukprot:TRINITY_DN79392_c0_g1_i1.p1 TRINITY_DN79392_c0_g1~~TRINITY_DN79392_c0_g1_i1.p1  ORF type:complete len:610 (-),score=143.91 TRINITY_DN79392_c0_g1_i1:33-1862(-)
MAQISLVVAPLPDGNRGYRTVLDVSSKGDTIAYCNAKHVFLRSLSNLDHVEVFSEHKCQVNCARFSPNGEWVASGDNKGRVLIWSVKTQMVKSTVEVNKRVLDLAWSDDNQRILAVGDGSDTFGRAFIWNSGNNIGEITGHVKLILTCDFKPTRPYRLVTGSEDQIVNFFTGPPFKLEDSKRNHTRYPNQVAFSKDGASFISVGADKKIVLYEGKTGEVIKEIEDPEGHSGGIIAFAWSPDNTEILTVSADQTSKIWNVGEGKVITTFRFSDNEDDFGHQQVGAVWTKDYLLSLALRGNLNFLDKTDSSKPKKTLKGHQSTLTASAVDPVSKQVYVADLSGRVCRYEGKSSECEEITGRGHGNTPIPYIAVNAAGDKFITVGNDDNFLVSETKGDSFGNASVALGGQIAGAALGSKNVHRAYVATKNNKLFIIDFSGSPSIVGELELPWKPTTIALSPDEAQIAVAGAEKLILITISGETLTISGKLEKHVAQISALAYSPDGRYIASADRDKLIWCWDRVKGEPSNTGWKFHDSMPTSVEFSPDGTKCLTASMDGNVIVWKDLDTFNNKQRGVCENAHLGGVTVAHWIDNSTFVSIGDDRTIKFWALK